MLGKFKPEELMSHQHSFSDAQNAITLSVNTAEIPFSLHLESVKIDCARASNALN
jgi:hypothetical protein